MAFRYSLAEIAKHLNTSTLSLAAVLRDLGLEAVGRRGVKRQRVKEIMKAYRLWNASKQGAAFGISRTLIRAAALAQTSQHKRGRDKAVSAYLERDLESLSQRDE